MGLNSQSKQDQQYLTAAIKQAGYDFRHRSRVVALFHGQQVVAASLRERENAAKRDSTSNARTHTYIYITHTRARAQLVYRMYKRTSKI